MARLTRRPGGKRNKGNHGKNGPYYAHIDVRQPNGSYRVKSIPLKTQRSTVAAIRLQEVEDVEALIKEGIEYSFPWMNGQARMVVRTTLSEAGNMYLTQRKLEGLRAKTLEIYTAGLRHLVGAIGADFPIEEVSEIDVQTFHNHLAKGLVNSSINVYLRTVKTFLIWAQENKLIETVPRIKQILCDDHLVNPEFVVHRFRNRSDSDSGSARTPIPVISRTLSGYRPE